MAVRNVPLDPPAAFPTYRQPPGWPPEPIYDTTTPPPTIAALVPNTAALGAPNFTRSLQGTGFVEGSVIVWNGSPEPTTFVSPTELTTAVNMATAAAAIELPVCVQQPSGNVSNTVAFTLTES